LPWLVLGLIGSVIATWIMALYEQTLQARMAVAFFVPAVVYIANAIGMQTGAIAIRGLSLSRAPLQQLLIAELLIGLMIGGLLALIIYPATLLVFGDSLLALTVSISVAVAGAFASAIGLLFPWVLYRLGKDPAYGSGPVATILQDVFSLLSYFIIATLLLI
jgi:magnesium transporter